MQSCGGSSCLSDGEKTLLVQINGEVQEIADGFTLSDLVVELSLAPERIAIERNHSVVRRNEWPTTIIADGDRIEIVHFVGGGSEARPSGRAASKAESRRFLFHMVAV